MTIPSVTSTSATIEPPRNRDERPSYGRAGRTWLSWLALAAVFVAALYLAGLRSGTAPEDFATVVAPP